MSTAQRAPVAYGGQAVIEGVMMRGQHHFAVACRRRSGEIVVKEEAVPAFFTRYRWARWPFLRGTFALADTLVLGMKSLLYSANLAAADTTAGPAEPGSDGKAAPAGAESEDRGRQAAATPVSGIAVAGAAAAGLGIGIGLFILLPTVATGALQYWFPGITALALNLVEGGVRAALVLGYISLIGRMPEVTRLFKYHGAEHKAINGLEIDGVAEVDSAMRQSRIHPRCGTNFLLTLILIKVVIASFFGWPDWWWRIGLRLALLPVVAGVAYEVIRLAGKYRESKALKLVITPGLLTQQLTTREPEREMVEVAVAALRSVMRREGLAPEEERVPAQV